MGILDSSFGEVVRVTNAPSDARILIVCEHASNRIPAHLGNLGLSDDLLENHIAWDPGAFYVAETLADMFGAPLVYGGVSRLIYDCNRPPHSSGAILDRSDVYHIPGNIGLSDAARRERVEKVYDPFRQALAHTIAKRRSALDLLVTVHSFTPVYMGERRMVEIGVLNGEDDRFSNAMMCARPVAVGFDVRQNEPYGPRDGVAHTLDEHGVANGLMNVMLEIRSDLIATETAQRGMAHLLADWIRTTQVQIGAGDAA